jgi:hypothetical protein
MFRQPKWKFGCTHSCYFTFRSEETAALYSPQLFLALRMIKIRAWYEKKLYMYVEHVTYNDGSSTVKQLGENEIHFSPDPNKSIATMLWTGLKDKAGKDIWQGDIVEFYYKGKDERCEIVLADGLFCLKWKDGYVNKYPLNPNNYTVVGNVHEMPDWRNY